MLKGISNVISPELIKILMEMGHGDELVIADGNFPAASLGEWFDPGDFYVGDDPGWFFRAEVSYLFEKAFAL